MKDKARDILSKELKTRGINFNDLSLLLAAKGVIDNHNNLARKIRNGAFSFNFFLQCLDAIGVQSIMIKI